MKRILFLIILITTILASCNNSTKEILEGKWRIVDIYNGKDNIRSLKIPVLIYDMAVTDVFYIQFTKEGKYYLVDKNDKILETKTFITQNNSIIIKNKNKNDTIEIVEKKYDLLNLKNAKNNFYIKLKRIIKPTALEIKTSKK